MFTNAFRDLCLAQLGLFVGLIKTVTDWRGATITEAAYTGYARQGVTWTAGNTTPAGGRQVSNTAAINFPQNTGANEDEYGVGVFSAVSAGTLQTIALLDDDVPIVGTVDAATDLVTAYAHGLVTDQRVFLIPVAGVAVPTGLAENVAYFVLASGLTADAFKLSLTSGGAAINVTVSGAAMFASYKAQTIATNGTPQFAIGQLVVQL